MSTRGELSAGKLAKALDLRNYILARKLLADSCIYEFRGEQITGADAIIDSYQKNDEKGLERFDLLQYESSIYPKTENHARIEYTDLVTHLGDTHIHRCAQEVLTDSRGEIVRLVHFDLEGEAAKLKAFETNHPAVERKVRKMKDDDIPAVTDLGIRSKASWGYREDMMAVFRDELTFTKSTLASSFDARVTEENGTITGFFTLRLLDKNTDRIELENLFIDPLHFGKGLGRSLFAVALQSAKTSGRSEMFLVMDPNAPGFYLKMGVEVSGEEPSSIPGRKIPVGRILLK